MREVLMMTITQCCIINIYVITYRATFCTIDKKFLIQRVFHKRYNASEIPPELL